MLTGLEVIGQSWDSYSDMGLAYKLATGTYTPACERYDYNTGTGTCISSKSLRKIMVHTSYKLCRDVLLGNLFESSYLLYNQHIVS